MSSRKCHGTTSPTTTYSSKQSRTVWTLGISKICAKLQGNGRDETNQGLNSRQLQTRLFQWKDELHCIEKLSLHCVGSLMLASKLRERCRSSQSRGFSDINRALLKMRSLEHSGTR